MYIKIALAGHLNCEKATRCNHVIDSNQHIGTNQRESRGVLESNYQRLSIFAAQL